MQYRIVEEEKVGDEWKGGEETQKISILNGAGKRGSTLRRDEGSKKDGRSELDEGIHRRRAISTTSNDRKWVPRDFVVKEMRMPPRMIRRLIASLACAAFDSTRRRLIRA